MYDYMIQYVKGEHCTTSAPNLFLAAVKILNVHRLSVKKMKWAQNSDYKTNPNSTE